MAEIKGTGTEASVSVAVSTTVGEKGSLNHMAPLHILTSFSTVFEGGRVRCFKRLSKGGSSLTSSTYESPFPELFKPTYFIIN